MLPRDIVGTQFPLVVMLAVLVSVGLLATPGGAVAQQAASRTLEIRDKIVAVSDRVQDMGGKVKDIEIKELPTEVRIDLSADVLFDFDKADILPRADSTLARAAQVVRDKGKSTARIDGYTDAKGSAPYNQRLSVRRADAVKTWFVTRGGIHNVTFETRGFGAANPVAPNTKTDGSDDPVGRQKNRRVEIVIQK
jgi:outer membrane protein OmpA-like peptidoglycan-associated protein